MKYFIWILRILATAILFQTLYFKFTAAPESVYIFSTLHVEPFGRLFAGFSELIAGALLLSPLYAFGAAMAAGIMFGALASHIFVLGIVVQNDGGLLFCLALVVLFSSLILIWNEKQKFISLLQR